MAGTISEKQLKTIYMFNFARFVKWPDAKAESNTFQFCVYPENDFGDILYQLEKRQIKDKDIRIKVLNKIADIQFCHVIFIDHISTEKLPQVLKMAQNYHVLTMSDQHNFAEKGGMIQMFLDDKKIRFKINYDSSQAALIKISSKLIRLATHVIKTIL
ncbi:MAG: YfiR family protein [Methylococcales bacterium]|nr:YfiR family protein [Methylococcales bacterium]